MAMSEYTSLLRPEKVQRHQTESYVSVPPALTITDERNDCWGLGFNTSVSGGEFCFDVLRNGMPTGEKANRIEYRSGVRIFGPEGWKRWNGRHFI